MQIVQLPQRDIVAEQYRIHLEAGHWFLAYNLKERTFVGCRLAKNQDLLNKYLALFRAEDDRIVEFIRIGKEAREFSDDLADVAKVFEKQIKQEWERSKHDRHE